MHSISLNPAKEMNSLLLAKNILQTITVITLGGYLIILTVEEESP